MTKERELLRRALEELIYQDGTIRQEFCTSETWDSPTIIEEIRAYLAAETEQHQSWCASLTQLLLSHPPQKAPCNCRVAKPAEPAIRKPMTEEEMRKGSGEWAHLHNIFEEGVRFAEKHHNILGE